MDLVVSGDVLSCVFALFAFGVGEHTPNETWMEFLRSILRNYSVQSADVPRNGPTNAEPWEIPFSREDLAFLGEIAQLKVRDAGSISPSGQEVD